MKRTLYYLSIFYRWKLICICCAFVEYINSIWSVSLSQVVICMNDLQPSVEYVGWTIMLGMYVYSIRHFLSWPRYQLLWAIPCSQCVLWNIVRCLCNEIEPGDKTVNWYSIVPSRFHLWSLCAWSMPDACHVWPNGQSYVIKRTSFGPPCMLVIVQVIKGWKDHVT